jgi:hypothetical protein
LGEIRAGQHQNLVGIAQFALLCIELVLAHPGVQELRHAANLGRDGLYGGIVRLVVYAAFGTHANSTPTHLWEKSV